MIPKRNENLWAILIFNLIYPAVLGTLIYSLLDTISVNDGLEYNSWLRVLAALSVIVFYIIDYLFSYLHANYGPKELIMHLFIIFSLFISVQMIGVGGKSVTIGGHYLFWLGITLSVFAIWDLLHLVYYQITERVIAKEKVLASVGVRTVIIEISMAVVFFTGANNRLQLLPSTIISFFGCIIMLINFIDWYRRIVTKK